MHDSLEGVTWFGGSSVRIRRAGSEIYVDPTGVEADARADLVLLTHPHYDAFSEEDISRVRAPHTSVIAPSTMKKLVDDADHYMRPGDMVHLEGFEILAVPAHNVDKEFHTPEHGWLGYVFTVDDTTYYHAGDTDFLPAMFGIRCDVAFLPCDGHYTMSIEEVAKAGEACGAEVIVPIRWGDPHGSLQDIERLSELFSREVQVLERLQKTPSEER